MVAQSVQAANYFGLTALLPHHETDTALVFNYLQIANDSRQPVLLPLRNNIGSDVVVNNCDLQQKWI